MNTIRDEEKKFTLSNLSNSPQSHISSSNIYKTKQNSQLISPLQIQLTRPSGSPNLIRLSKYSLATKTKSKICLPLMNAFWKFEIIFPKTDFSPGP